MGGCGWGEGSVDESQREERGGQGAWSEAKGITYLVVGHGSELAFGIDPWEPESESKSESVSVLDGARRLNPSMDGSAAGERKREGSRGGSF